MSSNCYVCSIFPCFLKRAFSVSRISFNHPSHLLITMSRVLSTAFSSFLSLLHFHSLPLRCVPLPSFSLSSNLCLPSAWLSMSPLLDLPPLLCSHSTKCAWRLALEMLSGLWCLLLVMPSPDPTKGAHWALQTICWQLKFHYILASVVIKQHQKCLSKIKCPNIWLIVLPLNTNKNFE